MDMKCTETCMTPDVSVHNDISVGTSPLFQAMPRLVTTSEYKHHDVEAYSFGVGGGIIYFSIWLKFYV